MARILVSSIPVMGHIQPLIPIVRALAARGHEVLWYSGAKYRDVIEGTGARFAGRRHARDFDDREADRLFRGRQRLQELARLAIAAIPGQVRDLEDLGVGFQPQVLLAETGTSAALLYAEITGVPLALLSPLPIVRNSIDTAPFGFKLRPNASALGRVRNRVLNWTVEHVILRDAQRQWNATRGDLGLPPTGWWLDAGERAAVFLQPTIPELEHVRSDLPRNLRFIGRIPHEAPLDWRPPPFWRELESPRPVVHVTQGTLTNATPQLIAPALAALAEEDVLVVVTTGGRPPDSLGLRDVPRNARIARYVSYAELLPMTAVMITNGGYGGVQMALAAGVPLVVAGSTEDKPEVAIRVARAGAGIDLRTATPSPRRIRSAVRRLLRDPRFRTRADELARKYAQYDAVRLAVESVERLLAPTRPPRRRREGPPTLSPLSEVT